MKNRPILLVVLLAWGVATSLLLLLEMTHWFYNLPQSDKVVHVAFGFAFAVSVSAIVREFKNSVRIDEIFYSLTSTAMVAVLWEFLEQMYDGNPLAFLGISIHHAIIDDGLEMFMDVCASMTGWGILFVLYVLATRD